MGDFKHFGDLQQGVIALEMEGYKHLGVLQQTTQIAISLVVTGWRFQKLLIDAVGSEYVTYQQAAGKTQQRYYRVKQKTSTGMFLLEIQQNQEEAANH